MKNSFYLVAFVLAVALAYAVSQTAPAGAPQQPANPGYSQPPNTHDMGMPQDQAAPDKGAAESKDADNHAHAAVDDSDIQKQVQQQMAAQNFNAVSVSVEKGVVTLSGAVATKEDRKRARELAKAVAGVKSVHEKLTVDSAAASALPVTAAPGSSPAGAASIGSTESLQNTSGSIAGNASASSAQQAGSAAAPPPSATPQTGGVTGGTSGTSTGMSGQATGVTGQSTGVSGSATGATGQSTGVSGSATGVTGGTTGATSGQVGATSGQTGATGSVSGQTGPSATGQTSATGTTSGTMTTEEGGDLQGRIDSALKSEPTLTGSSVMVNVTGDTIELSGSVPTGKEKQTADRIASSFAGNRKVVDRITVTGQGNGANNPAATPPSPNPQGADQDQNKNQNQPPPPSTPKR